MWTQCGRNASCQLGSSHQGMFAGSYNLGQSLLSELKWHVIITDIMGINIMSFRMELFKAFWKLQRQLSDSCTYLGTVKKIEQLRRSQQSDVHGSSTLMYVPPEDAFNACRHVKVNLPKRPPSDMVRSTLNVTMSFEIAPSLPNSWKACKFCSSQRLI